MDNLIGEMFRLPHAGDCNYVKKSTKCSCGVHDLMRDAVAIKGATDANLSKCRMEGLQAIKELLETFATR